MQGKKNKISSVSPQIPMSKPNPDDYKNEALDFLKQSLEDYDAEKWKFAVLHAGMAIEMLLKERLVQINPGAVLERIDEPNCKTTVAMAKIIPRLETFGIQLKNEDRELIAEIAGWRNDVAHRKLIAKKEDVEKKLSAIFKFFSRFLDDELDTEIKEALDKDSYKEFRELLKEWDDVVAEAQEEASEAGYVDNKTPSETYDCPECWGVSDTVAFEDGKAHCFLCKDDFESATCSRCSQAIIGEGASRPFEDGPTWCEGCAGDMLGGND